LVHLIFKVKVTLLDETFGEAKRHRSVIGPFARSLMERTAADHQAIPWNRNPVNRKHSIEVPTDVSYLEIGFDFAGRSRSDQLIELC
jgi:hypothetical protein